MIINAIIGSEGFLGSKLSKILNNKICFDITLKNLDIKDFDDCVHKLKDIDIVYHLAGYTVGGTKRNPFEALNLNVMGTRNIMEACRINDIPKILFVSSASVYDGIPVYNTVNELTALDVERVGLFGLSKIMGEQIVKEWCGNYGMKYVILRPGPIYGKGSSCVIDTFLNAKKMVINGKGERLNQYTYIDDLIDAVLKASEKDNDTYVLASPERLSMIDIAEMIGKKFKKDFYFDDTKEEGEGLPYMNCTKAFYELNWKPRNLEKGLDSYGNEL